MYTGNPTLFNLPSVPKLIFFTQANLIKSPL